MLRFSKALGVSESVVDKYFTGTVTRIGGIDINQIDKEAQLRHEKAFDPLKKVDALEAGGNYKWRKDGECHMFNQRAFIFSRELVVRAITNFTKSLQLWKTTQANSFSESEVCLILRQLKAN